MNKKTAKKPARHVFTKPGPGRPRGAKNKIPLEGRALAHRLLSDPAYVESLRKRLLKGTAGSVEVHLWTLAYGKPVQPIALETAEPLRFTIDIAGAEQPPIEVLRRLERGDEGAGESESVH